MQINEKKISATIFIKGRTKEEDQFLKYNWVTVRQLNHFIRFAKSKGGTYINFYSKKTGKFIFREYLQN